MWVLVDDSREIVHHCNEDKLLGRVNDVEKGINITCTVISTELGRRGLNEGGGGGRRQEKGKRGMGKGEGGRGKGEGGRGVGSLRVKGPISRVNVAVE